MSRVWYLLVISLFLFSLCLAGFVVLSFWPQFGAASAAPMRRLIGNQGVAQLETLLFTVQDELLRRQHEMGLAEPETPWQNLPTPLVNVMVDAKVTPTLPPTQTPAPSRPMAMTTPSPIPSLIPSPSPPPQWTLPSLSPFTNTEEEGVWSPYLGDGQDQVVGIRTFLQPDSERPYAVVGIVAIDLTRTQLNYVLGTDEPTLQGGPRGGGAIPLSDKKPGFLLATFNGGFMASHGQYGAMSGDIMPLPAKPGYATIALAPDGEVQIGRWGEDIDPAGQYEAWRQNGAMVVDNGLISDRVYNGSINTWGSNLDGHIVTWRSGVGLNEARDVLYFFAGPSLSMPTLAGAMQTAGVHDGFLLDINATWVHFAAIRSDDGNLQADPLFAEGMESNPDRYLLVSPRDFFYVTLRD